MLTTSSFNVENDWYDFKSRNRKKHSQFKSVLKVEHKYCDEKNFHHHLNSAKIKQERLFYHSNQRDDCLKEGNCLKEAIEKIYPSKNIKSFNKNVESFKRENTNVHNENPRKIFKHLHFTLGQNLNAEDCYLRIETSKKFEKLKIFQSFSKENEKQLKFDSKKVKTNLERKSYDLHLGSFVMLKQTKEPELKPKQKELFKHVTLARNYQAQAYINKVSDVKK